MLSIVNRQSSIVNRQSSIKTVTRLSTIIGFVALSCATTLAHAVSNAAGTSFAVRNTTKVLADGGANCTVVACILMSSDGALNNDNHGVFVKSSSFCYSSGANGGRFVVLNSAMTSTAISTLSFTLAGSSTLCGTANTWHIFTSVAITPNPIWAVKLDGSAAMPATLNSTNFMQCNPTGNFNTTTGCDPIAPIAPAAVSAPVDLTSNKKGEVFSKEISLE